MTTNPKADRTDQITSVASSPAEPCVPHLPAAIHNQNLMPRRPRLNNGTTTPSSETTSITSAAHSAVGYDAIVTATSSSSSSSSLAVGGAAGAAERHLPPPVRDNVNDSPTPSQNRDLGGKHSHRFLGRFGAIELENKGSVARDHLALERTFLAWLRTSLAFASIGIAVTQLFRLNSAIQNNSSGNISHLRQVGKPLGATFLAVSILVLAIGVNRYYESQSWLLKGKFPASRGSIFLMTLVASLLIIASLVIVIAVAPSQFET